ncbi:DUF2273 domain-containing protein [Enterococcus plantarum]|uniref:DUF2273 domain-containing protein n=1 Tax=Enterococcus plantarum TaxID=1077675 RepID=UPI001A8CD39E|nr:DUF2273 domain-containing protein [Enterococcus plantarum]MBO0468680.1 DUF2273 domain-containing protein [Enterococcus plantarum]
MKELLKTNQSILIGGVVGLLFALFFITIGFFKTLLLFVFTFIGSYGGYYVKKSGLLDGFLSKKRN